VVKVARLIPKIIDALPLSRTGECYDSIGEIAICAR
jgi:hypothetical protein